MSPLRKHLEVDGVCSDWFEVFGVVPRGCVLERSFLVVSVLALAVSASRTYGVGQKISCCTVIAISTVDNSSSPNVKYSIIL